MAAAATYDREADALYISWSDADTARTAEVDDYRVLDMDAAGAVVGMEVLYPSENLVIAPIARDFGFADMLDDIDSAVAAAPTPQAAYTTTFSVFYSFQVGITGPSTAASASGQSHADGQVVELTTLAS